MGITALYVLWPLFGKFRKSPETGLADESELDRLLDRKSVIERNIEDLEFEYKMGRMSEADFQQLEAGYKKDAADIVQKLEKLGVTRDLDDWIEKEIADRKKSAEHHPAKCPSCGAETAPRKKYCADCGHPLK
jgi:hypothetical protein